MRVQGQSQLSRMMATVVCLVGLLVPGLHSAQAQRSTVIYRCTDVFGRVTVQNDEPCPKGSQSDRRVVETPRAGWHPPPQYYRSRPDAPKPPASVDAEAPALSAGPPPPPALFRCTRMEQPFLSEDGEPEAVCMGLHTIGIDGSSRLAAGMACEVPETSCEPVAEADLCKTWGEYLREKLAAWKFGPRENAAAAETEYEAARARLAGSQCGQ